VPGEIVIAGGAEIYKLALPLADRIELTEVHLEPNGATRMPAFDMGVWRETLRQDHATPDNLRYSYVVLERTPK
jgi:dihydrofolate reductase